MQTRRPTWAMATMVAVCASLLSGCEAQVWGALRPPRARARRLDARIRQATAEASASGAAIETVPMSSNG